MMDAKMVMQLPNSRTMPTPFTRSIVFMSPHLTALLDLTSIPPMLARCGNKPDHRYVSRQPDLPRERRCRPAANASLLEGRPLRQGTNRLYRRLRGR